MAVGKRYVVAVSGGVDSVVLLDTLAKLPHELLVVAHFDHGIREESAEDARFVERLAAQYGLPYISKRAELGPNASEAAARRARYDFLRTIAERYEATIATAHHADDVVETVAINLLRGTGWRGLAVLNDSTIERPLIHLWKEDLYTYALGHRLEWVEDATNATDAYLRNRLRHKIAAHLSIEQKKQIQRLWGKQRTLVDDVRRELDGILRTDEPYGRYFMTMIDMQSARELLREVVLRESGVSLLRSQLDSGVLAIRTARADSRHHLASGVELSCQARRWNVQIT